MAVEEMHDRIWFGSFDTLAIFYKNRKKKTIIGINLVFTTVHFLTLATNFTNLREYLSFFVLIRVNSLPILAKSVVLCKVYGGKI